MAIYDFSSPDVTFDPSEFGRMTFERTQLWYNTSDTQTNAVFIDACVTLGMERVSEYTEYTIESGSRYADHVVHSPPLLSFTIAQSQTPNNPGDGFENVTKEIRPRKNPFVPGGLLAISQGIETVSRAAVNFALSGGNFESIGGEDTMLVNVLQSTQGDRDRIGELFDLLEVIQTQAYTISVYSRRRMFDGYSITRVGYRTDSAAGIGYFDVEAKLVQVATTQQAKLPNPSEFRNKELVDANAKAAAEAQAKKDGNRSYGKKVFDTAGVFEPGSGL